MLADKINQDSDAALKAGETERLGVLRLIKTSLKNEEIKLGQPLSDEQVTAVVVREAKQRRDSMAAYKQANRPELAQIEENELAIIGTYLPKQLTEAEIGSIVDEAMAAAGSNPQMGAVIGAVRSKVGTSADGAIIAKLVRERLG